MNAVDEVRDPGRLALALRGALAILGPLRKDLVIRCREPVTRFVPPRWGVRVRASCQHALKIHWREAWPPLGVAQFNGVERDVLGQKGIRDAWIQHGPRLCRGF